jgi:hypothetical protein
LAAAFLGFYLTISLGGSASPSILLSPLLSLDAVFWVSETTTTTAFLVLEVAVTYDEAVSFGFIEAPVKAGAPPFSFSFFSFSIISLICLSLSSCCSCFNFSAVSSFA